jgi:predicted enzyme related to lactoylglutathione lyase
MATNGIGYVNIFVRDLERAVEFYQKKLGLALNFSDADHAYASLKAGPISLGLAVAGEDQQELLGRHTGVGLVVDDLEAEYARLVGLGVRFSMPPERQPWGGFMALVDDPDDNKLYLDEVSAAHTEAPHRPES